MRPYRLLLLAALSPLAACGTSSPEIPGLRLADAAMTAGAPATALHVAQGMLARRPHDEGALQAQGDALLALGRVDEAAASYREVKAAVGRLGLGKVRLMQGDAAGAAEAFQAVLAETPEDARALNDLGIAQDLLDRHAEAQAAYRAAIEHAPEMEGARVNLGLSLALAGDRAGSLAILRPLAADPGTSRRVRADLAVALTLAGDGAGASAVLRADLPPTEVAQAVAGYAALRP